MRALLDTDVILDLVLSRDPFAVEAAALWLAHEQDRYNACVSPITPVNVFYIVRRVRDLATARKAVQDLLATIQVVPLTHDDLRAAEALPMTDFEDAVQTVAALAAGCDAIVTRNGKDYTNAPIAVFAPGDFLASLPTITPHDAADAS